MISNIPGVEEMTLGQTTREDRRSQADLACDTLYRLHQDSLVRFARLRGCDEHEAWDVVQELFLRVFRTGMILALSTRGEDWQRAWLLRTLRWMICNHHRHRTTLKRGSGAALESLDQLLDDGLDVPCHDTPATEHDRRWALSVLERGIGRLRASMRPAAWAGVESSLFNGVSAATPAARVAAHRARVRLRELIRGESCEAALYQAASTRNSFELA